MAASCKKSCSHYHSSPRDNLSRVHMQLSRSFVRSFVRSTCRRRFFCPVWHLVAQGDAFFSIRRVRTTKGTGFNQTHATPPENSLHLSSGNSRWTLKHPGPLSGESDRSRSHNRQRKSLASGGNRVKIRYRKGLLQKLLIEHDGSDPG